MADYIDVMSLPMAGPSRWDRGDGHGAILAFDAALTAAGLPGRLTKPLVMLARAEDLAGVARTQKERAAARMDQATRSLVADGPVDVAAYTATLAEVAVWLDEESPAMLGLMMAAESIRRNAVQAVFMLVHGIYGELSAQAATVVAEVEPVVPVLPREVWTATSPDAGTVAARAGQGDVWGRLVLAADKWTAIHGAAAMARESGQLAQETQYPGGCPSRYGSHYLGWEAAEAEVPRIRRLPEALWVPAMVRAGLVPGLYLAADHATYRERQAAKARPGLLARLTGPKSKPETVEVM